MALLIILALNIVALFVGLGFVVKSLILAVVAALIWLIAFFMRGAHT